MPRICRERENTCFFSNELSHIWSEVYSEPCQTYKMKRFMRTANNYFQPLIIFAKSSILDIWHVSEYTSDYSL